MAEAFTTPQALGVLGLLLWVTFWKGMALYKSGKLQQKAWFIWMLLINSAGILPMIYLFLNRKR